eukprot:1820408-Rhodomonas_salina.2
MSRAGHVGHAEVTCCALLNMLRSASRALIPSLRTASASVICMTCAPIGTTVTCASRATGPFLDAPAAFSSAHQEATGTGTEVTRAHVTSLCAYGEVTCAVTQRSRARVHPGEAVAKVNFLVQLHRLPYHVRVAPQYPLRYHVRVAPTFKYA